MARKKRVFRLIMDYDINHNIYTHIIGYNPLISKKYESSFLDFMASLKDFAKQIPDNNNDIIPWLDQYVHEDNYVSQPNGEYKTSSGF